MLRLSDITSKVSTDSICDSTFWDNMFYIQCIGVFVITCSAYFKLVITVLVFVILIFSAIFFPSIIPHFLPATSPKRSYNYTVSILLSCICRLILKCDGTRAETRFCLSAKRTSPFKSARASVQSTTGRQAAHISLQGLYCSCKPVFCSHVTLTGYPLHSLVSPLLLHPCVTVCHHISTGFYYYLIVATTSRQGFDYLFLMSDL
jgi:hypothetical protein